MPQSAESRNIGGVGTEGGPSLPAFCFPVPTGVHVFPGAVADLHAPFPSLSAAHIRVGQPVDSAMVLGRSQAAASVNETEATRLGVSVLHRESGGGAVFVTPSNLVWIDVIVPRGHTMWSEDVNHAFYWIGELFKDALQLQGISAEVFEGAFECNELCKRVCFAGMGPGEVSVAGKKLVGISQRRTREGARFQISLMLHWDSSPYVELLNGLPSNAGHRLDDLVMQLPSAVDLSGLLSDVTSNLADRLEIGGS